MFDMFGKKRLEKAISKLSLEQGDVIVLRTNKGFRKWIDVLRVIVRRLKIYKNIDVSVMVLPEDMRFGKVSEKEMNDIGWFRQDKEEMIRILEENKSIREWNENIKKLHVDESLKSYDEIQRLKKRLEHYEGKG